MAVNDSSGPPPPELVGAPVGAPLHVSSGAHQDHANSQWKGIKRKQPPCCEGHCGSGCRYVTETNPCFTCIGAFGFSCLSKQPTRAVLMYVSSFVNFLAFILVMCALFSHMDSATTIKNTHWVRLDISYENKTQGPVKKNTDTRVAEFEVYLGIHGLVIDFGGDVKGDDAVIPWTEDTCDRSGILTQDACNSCKDSMLGSFMLTFATMMSHVGLIDGAIKRSSLEGDRNIWKIVGFIAPMMGLIQNFGSVFQLQENCYGKVPDKTFGAISGGTIKRSFGVGLMGIFFSYALCPVVAILNLLQPVPLAYTQSLRDEVQKINDQGTPD